MVHSPKLEPFSDYTLWQDFGVEDTCPSASEKARTRGNIPGSQSSLRLLPSSRHSGGYNLTFTGTKDSFRYRGATVTADPVRCRNPTVTFTWPSPQSALAVSSHRSPVDKFCHLLAELDGVQRVHTPKKMVSGGSEDSKSHFLRALRYLRDR